MKQIYGSSSIDDGGCYPILWENETAYTQTSRLGWYTTTTSYVTMIFSSSTHALWYSVHLSFTCMKKPIDCMASIPMHCKHFLMAKVNTKFLWGKLYTVLFIITYSYTTIVSLFS